MLIEDVSPDGKLVKCSNEELAELRRRGMEVLVDLKWIERCESADPIGELIVTSRRLASYFASGFDPEYDEPEVETSFQEPSVDANNSSELDERLRVAAVDFFLFKASGETGKSLRAKREAERIAHRILALRGE